VSRTGEARVMVRVESAEAADCRALAETSKWAFDHDVKYGAPGPGGPQGYDSPSWHKRAFVWGQVFRLVHEGQIVGGAIVIVHGGGHMELGRIWLEPAAQGRGWGAAAMGAIEELFPDACRWTLETPCWNLRTQGFYTTVGFRETRRTLSDVYYEKQCRADGSAMRPQPLVPAVGHTAAGAGPIS
jgi:ribosomal protein S18 acetylase RimI-like enzyme